MEYEKMTTKDFMRWIVIVVCVIVGMSIYTNPPSLATMNIVFLSIIGASLIAGILYYIMTIPTNKRIIDKLKNAGYECGMQEGKIVFRKNNCDWYLFVGDVSRRYRKVSIYLGFTLEELDKDHSLTNRMVCIVAGRNSAVATSWDGENNVRFLYHTIFTSTKDILREFSSATDAINTAASEFFTVKERLMDNVQSVNEHKVGFQYGEKADVETESEIQDIRAEQTNINQ